MISKLNDIKINMNELLFYLLKFKTKDIYMLIIKI